MTARALGVSLVIARRDSRAYEGSAVKINYMGGGDRIETMALARRAMKPGQRVLIVDDFMKGGGTLQGIGTYLKAQNPAIKVVAVEPRNSASLLGREPGLHQIEGIGDGFVPDVLDVGLVDMVFTVSDEEAVAMTRRLASEEGLLVGTSSGANVAVALQLDNGHKRVVTILPDRAERYFSTALL